jgi:hypothetical protein
VSYIPVSVLKKTLDNTLGEAVWWEFETETLVSELQLPLTNLLHDKLSFLKVFMQHPELFFEDTMFFLHSVSVMNNEPADFEYVPHITSLEIAFAIVEVAKMMEVELHAMPNFGVGSVAVIKEVLKNEGFSAVVPPFDVVGVGALPEGQTAQDTEDKRKAIEEYIHATYTKPSL